MKSLSLKNIFIVLISICIHQFSFSQWNLIGTPIVGEGMGDNIGANIKMSGNGQRIVIGARANEGSGTAAGHVRVFEHLNGDWMQMGADIDGVASHNFTGTGVSINEDGTRIIVGSPGNDDAAQNAGHARIFEWDGTNWQQLGSSINGLLTGDEFGEAVDMNALGDIVIIGSGGYGVVGDSPGHARIFQLVNGQWQQVGAEILGVANSDYFGEAVSMDSSGTRVAIGARGNDISAPWAGHVRIFDFVNGMWQQVGATIYGESSNDQSGGSVDISADGQTVIIGSKKASNGGSGSGQARIFKYDGANWSQVGTNIEGNFLQGALGESVSINSNGSIVAVGHPNKFLSGMQDVGQALVYRFDGTDWEIRASSIDGTTTNNEAGSGVSIGSSDPLVVAVGLPGGTSEGKVEIYELATANIDNLQSKETNFTIFPNPSDGFITVRTAEVENGTIHLYSHDGKCVFEKELVNTSSTKLDISSFDKGVYHLLLTINTRSSMKKVVVQ